MLLYFLLQADGNRYIFYIQFNCQNPSFTFATKQCFSSAFQRYSPFPTNSNGVIANVNIQRMSKSSVNVIVVHVTVHCSTCERGAHYQLANQRSITLMYHGYDNCVIYTITWHFTTVCFLCVQNCYLKRTEKKGCIMNTCDDQRC